MCNRHVPHLIAEYEASKRDDVEVDEPGEDAQSTSDSAAVERKRLFASLVARLTP